jgi:hypothetical protein
MGAVRGRAPRLRLIAFALTVLGLLVWIAFALQAPLALDAHAYYVVDLAHPYGRLAGDRDAFLYAPAIAQALQPFRLLPWEAFRDLLRGAELGAMTYLAGPLILPLLFAREVQIEINIANIHLLLALVVVLGFRWPALWSFVLLTKVTPGVGLLWFAVRREWRKLAIALGATAAIVLVSFAAAPGLWFDWVSTLMVQRPPADVNVYALPGPLAIRLPLAAALVMWGALNNHRWTVLIAAWAALPVPWEFSVVMLTGLPRLVTLPPIKWPSRRQAWAS